MFLFLVHCGRVELPFPGFQTGAFPNATPANKCRQPRVTGIT